MKKIFKNNLFSFILTAAIFLGIGAVFAFDYYAQNVGYTPRDDSWKKESGEDIDDVKDALDELYLINKVKSDIITNVSFSNVLGNDNIKFNTSVEATDSGMVFGYHAFAIDSDQKIYSNMSTSNELTITGLTPNKSYNVYVIAYDKYNKYRKSLAYTTKTTSTLQKKNYSASNGSYPYVLTSGVEKKLINYGGCNLKLKKMYVMVQAGNSGAISASTITAYVYGYTNGAWELIRSFSAGRGVRVSSQTVVNTTIDLSGNEKVYTDFYVSAKSTDHEIYGAAEFQPTGVIID